jgi:hypothetical protein
MREYRGIYEVCGYYCCNLRCVRLTTLPPSCAVVMKSGNLNFLEPSGPHQACNWTAYCCNLKNFKFFYIIVFNHISHF